MYLFLLRVIDHIDIRLALLGVTQGYHLQHYFPLPAILPHLLASVLGLSAIMHMSAMAFQAVKYAGAAYLLYLAWSMWRDKGVLKFGDTGNRKGLWQIAVKGVLINILNPKLSIFFLAFLPLIFPSPFFF